MTIKLIRHATLLLKVKNKTLLIDPMLANKGEISAVPNVPNKSNNPLVALPVPKKALLTCDAVLITHHHRDHFDDAAINAIPKEKLIFCQPKDKGKIARFGFTNVVPINMHIKWGEITIARTPAKHGHGVTAFAMAPVSGFVISTLGEPTTYITGDSIWYCQTRKILDKFKPNIAICNCGEATFSQGKPITMGIEDINEICRHSPKTKVVAVHMEAWNHCRLTRKVLGDYIINNNLQNQVFVPADGEEIEFP